ncbi:MAG: alpha-hydroxy acid oxidase [Gammaproteobacteria bacterium]|nr:alpha-hydroxy acid oxidase [Gammaproteobacteria bacterium]
MLRHRLDACLNIRDLRDRARAALPSPVLGYLESGADDEYSLDRNLGAYRDYELLPRFLVDVSHIDTRTTVLGVDVELPVLLSPTGMSRLFHPAAELAAARAATASGTLYTLSTLATETIESVAAVAAGPKMFQIYVLKDEGLNREFIQRSREAGYRALCLTVDVPIGGNRETDLRTGMAAGTPFPWSSRLSFVTHPRWSLSRLTGPAFALANIGHRTLGERAGLNEQMEYVFSQFVPTVTWDDAASIAREWGGPFAVKGIMSAADARRAADIGATAVIVSNHGGRQLDTVPATVDCLAPIVDAVGDRLEVILDGGIRRGTDVLKAMAMGARACMIGRPYLYGLATAGEAGVTHALDIFRAEIQRDLALLGCPRLTDVDHSFVRRARRGNT